VLGFAAGTEGFWASGFFSGAGADGVWTDGFSRADGAVGTTICTPFQMKFAFFNCGLDVRREARSMPYLFDRVESVSPPETLHGAADAAPAPKTDVRAKTPTSVAFLIDFKLESLLFRPARLADGFGSKSNHPAMNIMASPQKWVPPCFRRSFGLDFCFPPEMSGRHYVLCRTLSRKKPFNPSMRFARFHGSKFSSGGRIVFLKTGLSFENSGETV